MTSSRTNSHEHVIEARSRLDQWTFLTRGSALRDALDMGEQGVELLLEQVTKRRDADRIHFVAALGDATGDRGIDELRSLLQAEGPGTQDLKCVALMALAKRCKAGATEDLIVAFEGRDFVVREFAIIGLAAVGGDGAWESVFERWKKWLRTPGKIPVRPIPPAVLSVCYLLEYLTNEDRTHRLIDTLRSQWDRLPEYDRRQMQIIWPALSGDWTLQKVELPDPEDVRLWVQQTSHFFQPADL